MFGRVQGGCCELRGGFSLSSCVFCSHLHAAVRRCTAQHLTDIVDRMGPERILSGTKAVADRIFPAIARFAQDTSQQTRLVRVMAERSMFQGLKPLHVPLQGWGVPQQNC